MVNSTICYRQSITYTVTINGLALNYQWYRFNGSVWTALSDGVNYSGTNTAQLNISDATTAETGSYRVSVTFATLNQPAGYPSCIETSSTRERNLAVRPQLIPPVINSNQSLCAGNMPSLLTASTAAGGSGPAYTYQWQKSADGSVWTDISGETGLTYQPALLLTSTWFRITATDTGSPPCGVAVSQPVTVTINPLPLTSPIFHN